MLDWESSPWHLVISFFSSFSNLYLGSWQIDETDQPVINPGANVSLLPDAILIHDVLHDLLLYEPLHDESRNGRLLPRFQMHFQSSKHLQILNQLKDITCKHHIITREPFLHASRRPMGATHGQHTALLLPKRKRRYPDWAQIQLPLELSLLKR